MLLQNFLDARSGATSSLSIVLQERDRLSFTEALPTSRVNTIQMTFTAKIDLHSAIADDVAH